MEIVHKLLGLLDSIETGRVISIEDHACACHEAVEPEIECL
jgi:hypothetical protein